MNEVILWFEDQIPDKNRSAGIASHLHIVKGSYALC
jgi:hypothetical protein